MRRFIFLFVLLVSGFACLPSLSFGQTKNIDCGCTPSTKDNPSWRVVTPNGQGDYLFDPSNIKLLPSADAKPVPLKGKDIIDKTKNTALNACVFDYLMSHTELIPEEWKKICVSFPGTVFDDGFGNQFFRCLYWWDNRWNAGVVYTTEVYDDKHAAIM